MKKFLHKLTSQSGTTFQKQKALSLKKIMCGLLPTAIALAGFHSNLQAQVTADASFTITTNSVATYFKAYPNCTVSTDQGMGSASGDFYVSLGSTPTGAQANYIDVTATSGTIDSISYFVTGNSSSAKTVLPAVLGWATSAYSNTAADYSFTGPSASVTKGLANAVWLSYDMSGKGVKEVRFYRAVKGVAVTSPAIATGTTQGGAQTTQFYGINVYINSSPTPVTFTSIQAQPQRNGTVNVSWRVASEIGIKQYQVESSTDGNIFEPAGSVAANGGTGTYSLAGVSAVVGMNYYRVKGIGVSGGAAYSSVVPVSITASATAGISVYPNPVTGKYIDILFNNLAAGAYTAKLLNISGQQVSSTKLNYSGIGLQGIDIPNVSTGTYQLEVSNGNVSYTTSVVIQ